LSKLISGLTLYSFGFISSHDLWPALDRYKSDTEKVRFSAISLKAPFSSIQKRHISSIADICYVFKRMFSIGSCLLALMLHQ